jgi:hypothetical protein
MRKKRYYVSVSAGTVMENQGDAAYELEIEATEQDVLALQELFEQKNATDFDTFFRAHIPAVPYHYDRENDDYDAHLKKIYSLMYRVGTDETREHIKSMGLISLPNLGMENADGHP